MIEAIEDKIVVQVLKRSKSAGGIILPETAQDPQAYGKVLSKGDKVDSSINVGDILVMHPRGGMDVVIGKALLKVLKVDEIYGFLRDDRTLESLDEFILDPKEEPKIIS